MSLCELLREDFLCTSTNDHLNFPQSPFVLLHFLYFRLDKKIRWFFYALQGRSCTSQNQSIVLPRLIACTSHSHWLYFSKSQLALPTSFFWWFLLFSMHYKADCVLPRADQVYFPDLNFLTSQCRYVNFFQFLLLFLLHFMMKCALPKLIFCTPRCHYLYLSQSMLALPTDFLLWFLLFYMH